jgi:predicted metal-dependent hydrolase
MTERPAIQVRDFDFDFADVPRYWHGGQIGITTYFDSLSILFPAGERFFIASVKAQRAAVQNPSLEDDVRLFCTQEGIHGREHVRYNRFLSAQGYPIEAMEERVERLLARVKRRTTPRAQLAITCALEHFTAILAYTVLKRPQQFDLAHPHMASLWKWHALEECEHKAVAFDVYQAAGGSYWERVLVMVVTTVIFFFKLFEHQIRLRWANGTLFSLREWAALLHYQYIEPGNMRSVFKLYFAYFERTFHPWQLGTRAELESWQRTLGQPTLAS